MARFTRVETYPQTGFPDRMWGNHPQTPGNPLHDAFLRAARPVVELYSEALATLDVHGPMSSLWIHLTSGEEPDHVQVDVLRAHPQEIGERAFLTLCSSARRLDAAGRGRLALAVVHRAALVLGEARGWDSAALESCREHVEARGFEYAWASSWKSSPDRRHQARAVYRLGLEDGFGRARLEVRRRGVEDVVTSTDDALALCTLSGFRGSAKTLRWAGGDEVTLTPYWGLGASGSVEARHVDGTWVSTTRDDVSVRAPGGEGMEEDPDAPVPPVTASLD